MNIEITDLDMILQHLDITSLESYDEYTSEFTYKDQKILYKYIKQLQQENEQLKDNWNKLKEYIRNFPAIEYFSVEKIDNIRLSGKLLREDYLLDKMQELEQGSDE